MTDAAHFPDAADYRNALPPGSMLLEYRIDAVLGAGGFGITYLARDTHLEKQVAIKEYLPGQLALRALDGGIVPVNTDSEYDYGWGLKRFIQEARTLAKFSHPNIVRVNRFFEANGSGYMVMDYEAGESLSRYLKTRPLPREAALKQLLLPVLDGLEAVHRAGFLHRDIKPSNVFIRENETPVLLDFGSARVAGQSSRKVTTIVSPGYAPLEQYSAHGRQGAWSDIYALAGVMYRAVTGENPPDAVSRVRADTVAHTLAAARTGYSERFLKSIEWGLALDEKMRPQSVTEWGDLLSGRAPLTAFNRGGAAAAAPARVRAAPRNPPRAPRTRAQSLAVALIAVPALALLVWAIYRQTAPHRAAPPAVPAAQQVPAPAPDNSVPAPVAPLEAAPAAAPNAGEAQPAPAAPVPPERRPMPPRGFEALDRNGDGYLTLDELRDRVPAPTRLMLNADSDGDGRISPEEWRRFRERRETGPEPSLR